MDFVANPTQLIIASLVGLVVLLFLIIKCKLHALLAVIISALAIGIGSGMPLSMVTQSVTDGMTDTLSSIALIVGLGAMFGGILEASGAAQVIANKLIAIFGEKRAPLALGIAGILIGIPVFYDPAFIIMIPIAYSVARKTNKSLLYYVFAILTGLGIGSSIPPTPSPLLITGNLPVSLGAVTLVAVITAVPFFIVKYALSMFFGKHFFVPVPDTAVTSEDTEASTKDLPAFGTVLAIILLPIVLILFSSSASMLPASTPAAGKALEVLTFIGQPYLALIIANVAAMIFLCVRKGMSLETIESVFTKSLQPVAMIILVTSAGGVLKFVLRYSGMGTIIGNAFANINLPVIVSAFLIAMIMRIAVGSATVALTMTLGIIASFPQLADYSEMYIACIGMAALLGAGSFSHVNDSGFWLTKQYLGMDIKTAFKTWTMHTGLGAILQFIVLFIMSFIWA